MLLERLADELKSQDLSDNVDMLSDFQLHIEHATDLVGRKKVLFVDASVSVTEPVNLEPVIARQDTSYTTHAMTPPAVLDVYEQIYKEPLPECFQLAIRGYEFELGSKLTDKARENLLVSLWVALQWIKKSIALSMR